MAPIDELRQLFNSIGSSSSPPPKRTSDLNIAQFIINHAGSTAGYSDWKPSAPIATPSTTAKKHGGQGWFSRTMDIISRPLYATANAVKEASSHNTNGGLLDLGDVEAGLKGYLPGFTGKKKTTFSQVIKESPNAPGWTKHGVTGFATGLTADILGDPSTYIPIAGVIKAFGKGAKAVPEAIKPLLETSKKSGSAAEAIKAGHELNLTDVLAKPPVKGRFLESVPPGTYQAGEVLRQMQIPGIHFPETLHPSVTSAQDIVQKIASGEKTALPKQMKLPELDDAAKAAAHSMVTKGTKLTPAKQILLFNKFNAFARASGNKAHLSQALAMMKEIEKAHVPQWWDGTKVPISDVIADMGSKFTPAHARELFARKTLSPELQQSVEKVKAAHAIDDSATASVILNQGTREAAAALGAHSPAGAAQFMQGFKVEGGQIMKASGASPASIRATNSLLDNITEAAIPRGPQSALMRSIVEHGAVPKVERQSFNAARAAVAPAVKAGETVSDNAFAEAIGSRLASWYGQRDVRPFARSAVLSARASAEAWHRVMGPLFKGVAKVDRAQAMRAAQGAVPRELLSPKVAALSDGLRRNMEELLSATGLTEKSLAGNTVALRAGMVKDDLNAMLKRYNAKFRFSNVGKDSLGNPVKYSGADFLKSWEGHTFEGDKLHKEMFSIQSAVQQVAKEYAMVDDLAARFGKLKREPGLATVSHVRLGGVYFPKEMASQIQKALDTMHDFYVPHSPVVRAFREAQNVWKGLVTVVNPVHQVNNISGDIFLGWMAGVNNIDVYRKAASVMKTMNPQLKDMNYVARLSGNATSPVRNPGKLIVKTRSGKQLTAEQIYTAAHQHGLLQSAHVTEDILDSGTGLSHALMASKFTPQHYGAITSQYASQWTRLGHFIDAVSKSKASNLSDVFRESANQVAKWHPDGMDLTKFEQKLKLVIPFYSWLRKSTPLILEGAAMNPGKIASLNKVMYNFNTKVLGEDTSLNNPFNTANGLWPAWLNPPGTKGTVASPRNPFMDFASTYGGKNPLGQLAGNLTPGLKIPTELLLGKHIDSGQKISDSRKYLQQQTPVYSRYKSMTGSNGQNSFVNWSTGVNLQNPEDPNSKYNQAKTKKEISDKAKKYATDNNLLTPGGRVPKSVRDMFSQGGP